MKKMNFEQMEVIHGGWSLLQHGGCFLLAAAATGFSGGWAGPAAYVGCLLITTPDPFPC